MKYMTKIFYLLLRYSVFAITLLAIISPGVVVFTQAKTCPEREVLIQGKCIPKNISIPPADQATIRSEMNNTFETPFLVSKNEVVKMAKISGKVFLDKNANGVYNKADEKKDGVIVQLIDAKTKRVVRDLRIEDKNGYKFEVPEGRYYLQFEESDGLKWSPTPKNIGFDKSVDSDINAQRRTDELDLKAGKELKNVDAGFFSNLDKPVNPNKLVAIEVIDSLIKSLARFFGFNF
jgi:hypothetical protein